MYALRKEVECLKKCEINNLSYKYRVYIVKTIIYSPFRSDYAALWGLSLHTRSWITFQIHLNPFLLIFLWGCHPLGLSNSGYLMCCGDWSVSMTVKDGRTLPSREQHSSFIYPSQPISSTPCLAVPRPEPSLHSDHAVAQEVFLSGLHQCTLSSSGENRNGTAEDTNLLIWPWWNAYSTHSPPRSSFYPVWALSALPCHTHFIPDVLCMQRASQRHTCAWFRSCCHIFPTCWRQMLWAAAQKPPRFQRK